MQWKHKVTQKPAVMASTEPIIDTSREITEFSSLPSPEFWATVNMPPEIVAMGRKGIYSFIRAFLKKAPKTFYLTIFPSGFPDGVVPD